jgi:hypothetical protein
MVESTVEYSAALTNNTKDYEIGMMKDLYCLVNKVYYEAKIEEIKMIKGVKKIKFHFLHWGKSFDEWVDFDSERIQVHNLFTVPGAKPQDQEKFQGVYLEREEREMGGNSKKASTSKKAKVGLLSFKRTLAETAKKESKTSGSGMKSSTPKPVSKASSTTSSAKKVSDSSASKRNLDLLDDWAETADPFDSFDKSTADSHISKVAKLDI